MSVSPNDVTAVIPTRGDCDLSPILDSLIFRNVLIWDNSRLRDLGAYGRYAAALTAITPLIYTQDDDCIVEPESQLELLERYQEDEWLSNMPADWNGSAMPLLALPGWGAIFELPLLRSAVARWSSSYPEDYGSRLFRRIGCDIVFPVLTPSRMVDLGHTNLEHAEASNRTCKQPGYQQKKAWYYRRAAELRQKAAA